MTCGIVKKRIWRFSNVFVRKVVNMNYVILECRSVELNAVQPIIFEYSLRHHKFSSVILLKVTTSKKFYSCISCFSLYHNRSVTFVQNAGVSECKEIFFSDDVLFCIIGKPWVSNSTVVVFQGQHSPNH